MTVTVSLRRIFLKSRTNIRKETGMTIYKCAHCGNIIVHLKDSGVRCICCGEEMQPVVANTSDGAGEKHVPVIKAEGGIVTVTVGSVLHPMLDAHYIEWIVLETKQGRQRKVLSPGDRPEAVFALAEGDEPVAAYEHCNLHGLWKAEI